MEKRFHIEESEGYNEIQALLANYARQSRDAKEFAVLVEQYTDITEFTEELLHR